MTNHPNRSKQAKRQSVRICGHLGCTKPAISIFTCCAEHNAQGLRELSADLKARAAAKQKQSA